MPFPNLDGRPRAIPKISEEKRKAALEMVRAGRPLELIADALGIARSTLQAAKVRGVELQERVDAGEVLEGQELDEWVFCASLTELRAKNAFKLQDAVLAASDNSWKAQAWLLERMHHDVFGPRSKTELTGTDGGPIQVEGRQPVLFIPAKKPDE